ncbi:hypothetical protein [Azospira restricta]|uniref:Uncharacterized protein n=1 Tax=Azospira restricta TaxID=404405 RepID=A0A974SQ73_9RHOO|nr:hypothetical protein [Azospira restricta]QRJ64427.1 hypothetical protein IWH25_03490 [Azospira restricta]
MDDTKLGLWSQDNLAATVRSYNGSQYYQHLSEEIRFVHSVAKIISIRSAKDKEGLCSAPSLYVLGPAPDVEAVTLKREPTFSLGNVNVAGKIWFGSQAMNSSRGVAIPTRADTDAIFSFVSETLVSGGRPAIYFDGSQNAAALRYYPKGIDAADDCEDILFGGAHIDAQTLKCVMDRIHERSLITPTASLLSSGLWADGPKHYPVERAENAIQSIVEIGLAHALGNIRVKREGTGTFGRYDLSLVEQDPLDASKTTNHAVIELKIVKAFTKSGTKVSETANKTAMLKGVKQAFAYREEHKSRISALCCYDMRPTPSLQKISEDGCKRANDFGVKFWAWPLFSTTEAARNWLAENYLNQAPQQTGGA